MIGWLAVVTFCLAEECAFWASTEELFPTEAACAQKAMQAEAYFEQQGAQVLSVCLPIRATGKKT